MGRGVKGRRALAVILGIAAATPAWAQDASDLAYSLGSDDSLFESRFDDEDERELQRPQDPPLWGVGFLVNKRAIAVADPEVLEVGESASCAQSDYQLVQTDIFKTTGVLGLTPASNAAERRGGDDDLLVNGRLTYEWTHRSRDGACTPNAEPGEPPKFDEDWRIVTTVEAKGQDYLDDVNTDGSALNVSFVFSQRLGRSVVQNRFQTRAYLGLYNSVGYSEFYEDWGFTNHDVRLGLEHTLFSDGQRALGLNMYAGEVFANPDSGHYTHGKAELKGEVRNIGGDWGLIVTGSFEYRDYDEAVIPRQDRTYALSAVLLREIARDTRLGIGITVQERDSTDPTRDYATLSMPITLRRQF